MTDDEPRKPTPHPGPPPEPFTLSINQLVSYNLMRARHNQAMSQQDVAELLEMYTGRTWSNASVSAAERAWRPGARSRRFDASEIVAMTKIFDEPVAYFFLPPEGSYFSKWVAMREFPEGHPIVDPKDETNDLMALLPTAELIEAVGTHRPSTQFVTRMQELALQFLGLVWEPPRWRSSMRTVTSLKQLESAQGAEQLDSITVAELQQADEVASKLTKEELRSFLKTEARAIAYEVFRLWQEDGLPSKASDEKSDSTESITKDDKGYPPPPF